MRVGFFGKQEKKADVVLVETSSVILIHDKYAALVYSANTSNVQDVWINGEKKFDEA